MIRLVGSRLLPNISPLAADISSTRASRVYAIGIKQIENQGLLQKKHAFRDLSGLRGFALNEELRRINSKIKKVHSLANNSGAMVGEKASAHQMVDKLQKDRSHLIGEMEKRGLKFNPEATLEDRPKIPGVVYAVSYGIVFAGTYSVYKITRYAFSSLRSLVEAKMIDLDQETFENTLKEMGRFDFRYLDLV